MLGAFVIFSLILPVAYGQDPSQATVVIAKLNVRSGPGTNYAPVGSVSQGDLLPVVGKNSNCTWLKVRLTDKSEAWISGSPKYVKLSTNCSVVPDAGSPTSKGASAQAQC